MSLPTIQLWCTGRQFTPIRRFTIPLRDTTRQGWQSLLALVLLWAHFGAAAVGAMAAAGVATMTSRSTVTIISIATRTLAAATELPNYPLAVVPEEWAASEEQVVLEVLEELAELEELAVLAVLEVLAVQVVLAA